LHRALPLLDALSFKATARAVRRPQAAFRQLLLEYFQAHRIASHQGECLDRRKSRLPLVGFRQVPFGQTFLHCLANGPPQTLLKLFGSRHP
jgi:hypothetical protein